MGFKKNFRSIVIMVALMTTFLGVQILPTYAHSLYNSTTGVTVQGGKYYKDGKKFTGWIAGYKIYRSNKFSTGGNTAGYSYKFVNGKLKKLQSSGSYQSHNGSFGGMYFEGGLRRIP